MDTRTAGRTTRRPIERYRYDRKNHVILDTRTFAPEFLAPEEFGYRKGDPIFAVKRSSPARERLHTEDKMIHAVELDRIAANSPGAIAARIAAAAVKA